MDFVLDIAFYTLLVLELFASFFADTAAIAQRKTGGVGEKTPLLSSQTDSAKTKVRQKVNCVLAVSHDLAA